MSWLGEHSGSTQEDLSWHNWKIVDWDIKNQIQQKKTDVLMSTSDELNLTQER